MAPRLWGTMGTANAVPKEIGRRQFFQALANRGLISKEEAVAAVNGTLPEAIEGFIEQIADEEIAFDARMLFVGASTFSRAHPFVEYFGAMSGFDAVELDGLWRDAYSLY